jgi:hypothetical protein
MTKKDIQYNGQKRTRPRGHTNDLQNITQIIKD